MRSIIRALIQLTDFTLSGTSCGNASHYHQHSVVGLHSPGNHRLVSNHLLCKIWVRLILAKFHRYVEKRGWDPRTKGDRRSAGEREERGRRRNILPSKEGKEPGNMWYMGWENIQIIWDGNRQLTVWKGEVWTPTSPTPFAMVSEKASSLTSNPH